MPNHVTNWVVIKGSEAKIKKLKKDTIKPHEKDDNYDNGDNIQFDFNGIIPMPENIYRGDVGREEREKYGENNSLDWSVKNWGTKWGAYNAHLISETPTRLAVEFQTAWSPPDPIFETLEELGYEVHCFWQDEDPSNSGEWGEPYEYF